ncbi:MAG: ribosome maturation factor RimM [Bacteroidales bacterium]
MFNLDDFVRVGFVKKVFGYNGAVIISLEKETTFDCINVSEPVFLKLHGTLVPYFVSDIQGDGNNPVVYFENITSKEQAKPFINVECYMPAWFFEKAEVAYNHPDMLVGFVLKDKTSGMTGKIINYLDNNNNPLFEARFSTGDMLLPCHEDMILEIDIQNKTITTAYPEGLIA